MIIADASEYLALSRAIRKLPGEISAKAFARAGRRVTEMARTRYVRLASPRLDVPQKHIRGLTTAMFNAGGNTSSIVVKANWIGLYKLGAEQTPEGVSIPLRGSYKSAFIATMKNGDGTDKAKNHTGVFKRAAGKTMRDKNKPAIRELFGPNPANDIDNNDEVYLALLQEVIDEMLAPRVVHEIGRLLP